MMFDTLKASRHLRDAGFDEAQADALVTAFASGIPENLATKDDLAALEQRLTIRMYTVAGAVAAFLTAVMSIATAILLAAG